MADAILSATGLSKIFKLGGGLFQKTRQVRAVLDVDLEVAEGETLALVGESGCGKSTLGRLLLHLLPPSRGMVCFRGKPYASLNRQELFKLREQIQIIFQDPFSSLDPRQRVGSAIEEPLKIHGWPRRERQKRVAALLDRVGLRADQASNYPHQFSGGQRQRIGIARALALKPALVVADEPVSALDVSIQASILNLMHELQEELGLTYVFISHDLAVVRHFADRVAVMYLGRIVELAETGSLFAAPHHPYTRALLSAVPRIDFDAHRQFTAISGEIPSPLNPPSGCTFHPRCVSAVPACAQVLPALRTLPDGRALRCDVVEVQA